MENRSTVDQDNPGTGQAAPVASCAHHQSEKATELLSQEHRVIERGLAVVEKLTNRPVEDSIENWKKALDFIRYFADQCHHFKEEQVLFPAMEQHGIPSEGGPIGVMLMEHEEGRTYVRSMLMAIAAVEAKNPTAQETLLNNATAYLRLLREHIQKEDDVLFRIADEVISADEQKALLLAFEEHEAKEMGQGVHEKYLKLVEELEQSVP